MAQVVRRRPDGGWLRFAIYRTPSAADTEGGLQYFDILSALKGRDFRLMVRAAATPQHVLPNRHRQGRDQP
jgi:hypothetical protein